MMAVLYLEVKQPYHAVKKRGGGGEVVGLWEHLQGFEGLLKRFLIKDLGVL